MENNTTISRNKFQVWTVTICFFVVMLLMSGCAHKQKDSGPDFFEKWRLMAEQSQGYSPPPKEHEVEVTDIFLTLEDEYEDEDIQPVRSLPTNRVTLKFRDVDIRAIMRALARAAEMNIIMSSRVHGTLSINIDNMPWDQAFMSIVRTHGLDFVWEGDILRVMSVEDMQRDIEIENVRNNRMTALAKQKRLEPLKTSVVRVRYLNLTDSGRTSTDDRITTDNRRAQATRTVQSSSADSIRNNLERLLTRDEHGTPRGSISVDGHNNALIIQAIEDDTRRILRLLQSLDQPRPQVLLKAHIVETTQDVARELGVQWGGRYRSRLLDGDNRLYISPGQGAEVPGDIRADRAPWGGISPVGPIVDFPGAFEEGGARLNLMYGILDGNILEMQLSALQSDGRLNILSSPSITTLDNQMAFTENGERVPYVSRDGDGDPEVRFEDAVLRLEITPNIIDAEQLRLAVKVHKDEVDLSRTVQGNPFIIKKQTETNLVVADGETIVISGLTRERNFTAQDGVPGLKDIPGLGAFFRRDSRGRIMEEVLIFITPHILPYRPPHSREFR
ncbi:type IV pilus secretin PilQ [Desulfonatronovibrio magnus]|uniref:type IV pilus secretin PilQ n=1 Tax=Desulfonatronovibrio magnus TaxID=698827 RepID=UPI000697C584|nr:type IV pilus secretin PilQ [Desulfonatronovibrio magnus]